MFAAGPRDVPKCCRSRCHRLSRHTLPRFDMPSLFFRNFGRSCTLLTSVGFHSRASVTLKTFHQLIWADFNRQRCELGVIRRWSFRRPALLIGPAAVHCTFPCRSGILRSPASISAELLKRETSVAACDRSARKLSVTCSRGAVTFPWGAPVRRTPKRGGPAST